MKQPQIELAHAANNSILIIPDSQLALMHKTLARAINTWHPSAPDEIVKLYDLMYLRMGVLGIKTLKLTG